MLCLRADGADMGSSHAQVGIIMGSDSDLMTMKAAAEVLRDFNIRAEVTVVSAHRTPDRMLEYARSAHRRGIKVIALSWTPRQTVACDGSLARVHRSQRSFSECS